MSRLKRDKRGQRDDSEQKRQESAEAAEKDERAPEEPDKANAAADNASEVQEPVNDADETKDKAAENGESELRDKLKEAETRAAEYLGIAQRVQADFENFRRRNETVRSDSFADGRRDVAAVMLPVLDNLERAIDAAANSEDKALRDGVELVYKQMSEIYDKLGVTVIDRQGEKFDPNLENAILQGAPEEGDPGTVCQVLQKGYKMGDRVIRHAMVKVVPE